MKLWSLLLPIIIAGCADIGERVPPNIPIAELQNAFDTISVEGRLLYLSTNIWRDFMPFSPPDGKPLVAIAFISATDTALFPSTVFADAIWIIYGQEVWSAWLAPEPYPPLRPNRIERVARNGPKWGPHVYVDVIVRVFDGHGSAYLLRASHNGSHEPTNPVAEITSKRFVPNPENLILWELALATRSSISLPAHSAPTDVSETNCTVRAES